ncbi:hypothetical protein MNV49_002376 [Pseudohyphozyma bogoriensis]|nr:hypothetical protein MNV49_002376 [Pseudohyphozyma bogoriensis]
MIIIPRYTPLTLYFYTKVSARVYELSFRTTTQAGANGAQHLGHTTTRLVMHNRTLTGTQLISLLERRDKVVICGREWPMDPPAYPQNEDEESSACHERDIEVFAYLRVWHHCTHGRKLVWVDEYYSWLQTRVGDSGFATVPTLLFLRCSSAQVNAVMSMVDHQRLEKLEIVASPWEEEQITPGTARYSALEEVVIQEDALGAQFYTIISAIQQAPSLRYVHAEVHSRPRDLDPMVEFDLPAAADEPRVNAVRSILQALHLAAVGHGRRYSSIEGLTLLFRHEDWHGDRDDIRHVLPTLANLKRFYLQKVDLRMARAFFQPGGLPPLRTLYLRYPIFSPRFGTWFHQVWAAIACIVNLTCPESIVVSGADTFGLEDSLTYEAMKQQLARAAATTWDGGHGRIGFEITSGAPDDWMLCADKATARDVLEW